MGRPVYPYELADPDFSWLLNSFNDSHPHYIAVQDVGLPVVMVELATTSCGVFQEFAPPVVVDSGTEIEPEPK